MPPPPPPTEACLARYRALKVGLVQGRSTFGAG